MSELKVLSFPHIIGCASDVIYTIQDSQGQTFGIYTDYSKACADLKGWAESICDNVEVRDLPIGEQDVSLIWECVAAVYEDGERFFTTNDGEYTVQAWYKLNETV